MTDISADSKDNKSDLLSSTDTKITKVKGLTNPIIQNINSCNTILKYPTEYDNSIININKEIAKATTILEMLQEDRSKLLIQMCSSRLNTLSKKIINKRKKMEPNTHMPLPSISIFRYGPLSDVGTDLDKIYENKCESTRSNEPKTSPTISPTSYSFSGSNLFGNSTNSIVENSISGFGTPNTTFGTLNTTFGIPNTVVFGSHATNTTTTSINSNTASNVANNTNYNVENTING